MGGTVSVSRQRNTAGGANSPTKTADKQMFAQLQEKSKALQEDGEKGEDLFDALAETEFGASMRQSLMDIAEDQDLVTAQSFMLNPRRKAERRFNMKPQLSTRHELKLAEQAKGRGMRRKSRANSITVSSGVAGMRGPVAAADLKVLQESLRHFMFLGLEVQQNHTKFLSCFREARYVKGDKLIVQGNPAEHLQSFHVISDGEIGVTVDGRQVVVCKAGDHLGELSLLFKSLPSATCEVVSETAKTWVMTGADFRQQTRVASENSFAQRSLWLGEMESLSGLMPIQLKELSQSMSLLTVEPGMGIPADLLPQFVVITTGMVELSRKDRPAGGGQSGGAEDDALPTHHVAEHGQCCPVTAEQCELAGAGDASELAIVAGAKGVQLLHLPLPAFEMATGEAFADTRDRSLIMQILRGHAAFTHLDELQQRAISKLVSIVKFEAGAEYVKENDEEMVIVLDGSLAVGRASEPGGQPTRRSMHRRGSTTGVEALYVAQNNSASGKSNKTIYIGDVGARLGIIQREGVQEVLDGKHLDETSVEANTSKNAVRALRKDIAFDSLKEIAKLGQGTFGRVSLVSAPAGAADGEEGAHKRYALKVMLKDTVVENEQEEHVMDEKRVLQMLDHPFVISLVATFQTRESLYLLMECCYGGELWAVIHEKHGRDNPMPPDSVRFYAACICSALGHMHLKGIIFRDLKPENVLVANNGYLKIADMGLAKVLPYIGHDEKTGGEVIHHKAFTVCGTPEYISPEIIYNLGHDRASDYWSIGVLVFELLAGFTPFAPIDGDLVMLFKGICVTRARAHLPLEKRMSTIPFPAHVLKQQPRLCELVTGLLNGEPNLRLGMMGGGIAEIKAHPFFAPIGWIALEEQKAPAPWVPDVKSPDDVSSFSMDQTSPWDTAEAVEGADQFDHSWCEGF